ncbi:GNAT family N-acetyltransferase [Ensifer sp. 4252]|uniref:GNAT family N-acetyltransferase n=1 Tax=Ensifer sp. 4252 TaxID=3373915 RepID=UPI003D1DFBAB
MSVFAQEITEFWRRTFLGGVVLHRDDSFTVSVNPDLSDENRVMMLEATDGQTMAVLTAELADRLNLARRPDLTEPAFRRILDEASVTVHGADYVFYFPEAARSSLMRDKLTSDLRLLTARDEAAFAAFEDAASEQDLEDAYVELVHWAVFGAFEQGRLVCAASMYPWEDAQIADTGVLTLPSFRGKGHARNVVRAISRYAYEQGFEPQYRCQLDNQASAALAKAAGLALFGKWEVISPTSAN